MNVYTRDADMCLESAVYNNIEKLPPSAGVQSKSHSHIASQATSSLTKNLLAVPVVCGVGFSILVFICVDTATLQRRSDGGWTLDTMDSFTAQSPVSGGGVYRVYKYDETKESRLIAPYIRSMLREYYS